VSPGLERVRERARQGKKERFTALLHHVTVGLLRTSYLKLKRDAAPGVGGTRWREYGQDLEAKLVDLHGRVHRGTYRALPSRRKLIQKEDGREMPLGIAALEDKIVQRAVVEVLNAIYEQDFLGFSYGFRSGRGERDALEALAVGITYTKVSWIVDADVRSFFDLMSHEWLIRFVEYQIGDPRMIRKWLKVGVTDGAEWTSSDIGSPQGVVVSPTLANIYLHYTFDLWADQWRRHHARGNVVLVRYADDSVAGFEYETEAKRFLADLRERLEKFKLSLHPNTTSDYRFRCWPMQMRDMAGWLNREPSLLTVMCPLLAIHRNAHTQFVRAQHGSSTRPPLSFDLRYRPAAPTHSSNARIRLA